MGEALHCRSVGSALGQERLSVKNGKDGSGTITFDRLAQDGIEVAEYLTDKLGYQKVILIGSSAGSLIGIMMAKLRPDLFYAYVGTDQNAPDPQNLLYTLTVNALRGAGNTKGVQLLRKWDWIHPSGVVKISTRNRLHVKTIKDVPNMITDLILPSMLSSPEHKIRDMLDIFKGMSYSLDHLFDELINFDFKKFGMQFELPVFIFHGDNDIITPTELARAYSRRLKPLKRSLFSLKTQAILHVLPVLISFLRS